MITLRDSQPPAFTQAVDGLCQFHDLPQAGDRGSDRRVRNLGFRYERGSEFFEHGRAVLENFLEDLQDNVVGQQEKEFTVYSHRPATP